MLRYLLCLCIGHRPNRRRVWHDTLDYRARCCRCKTPMIRGKKRWRPYDPVVDANVHRGSHPRMG